MPICPRGTLVDLTPKLVPHFSVYYPPVTPAKPVKRKNDRLERRRPSQPRAAVSVSLGRSEFLASRALSSRSRARSADEEQMKNDPADTVIGIFICDLVHITLGFRFSVDLFCFHSLHRIKSILYSII